MLHHRTSLSRALPKPKGSNNNYIPPAARKIEAKLVVSPSRRHRQVQSIGVAVESISSPSKDHTNGVEDSSLKYALVQFPADEYKVGALCGLAHQNYVTFRPEIRCFRYEKAWHIIPPKYNQLPYSEMLRRMRIKLKSRGKIPWNVGKKHSPESIANIRSATIKALEREDVRSKYVKHLRVRLAMQKATIYKRKTIAREEKKKEIALRRFLAKERRNAKRRAQTARRRQELGLKPRQSIIPRKKTPPHTPEHKRNISDGIRKKWLDPVYRVLVSSKIKQYKQSKKKAETKAEAKAEKTEESLKECREKYDALMRTVVELSVEIDSLEIQKELVHSDTEVVQEIDKVMETAKDMISKIKSTVVKVEEELGIQPNTSLLNSKSPQQQSPLEEQNET